MNYKGGLAASRRRRRYGLEPEDHAALLSSQGGACALCGDSPHYDLYVDHDHETGRVRSLLCARCNNAAAVFDRFSWQDVLRFWAYCNDEDAALKETGNIPTH